MMQPEFRTLLLGVLFSVTIPFCAGAQQLSSPTPEQKWIVSDIQPPHIVSTMLTSHLSYGDFNLSVTENEKIVPVIIGNRDWGVVRVDKEGNEKWKYEGGKGDILGLSYLGDHILAIVVNNLEMKRSVTAVLIDKQKGTLKSEKDIFKVDHYRQPVYVANKPDGSFSHVLLLAAKKALNARLLRLKPDLTPEEPVELQSDLDEDEFCGSIVSSKGDIFLAGFTKQEFSVTRYNSKGKQIKRLATALERKWEYFVSYLQLLPGEEGIIAGLHYKAEKKDGFNRLVRADFSTGQVKMSERQDLNKAFARSANLVTIEGSKEGDFSTMDQCQPVGLLQWQGKTILLTEVRTSFTRTPNGMSGNRSTTSYENQAWMVSIYDKDLKLLSITGVDRYHGSFLRSSMSLGFHIYDRKLIVICPALRGAAKYTVLYCELNLETGKLEKYTALEELNTGASSVIESKATIWFDNSFLLQLLKGKLFTAKMTSTLIRVQP